MRIILVLLLATPIMAEEIVISDLLYRGEGINLNLSIPQLETIKAEQSRNENLYIGIAYALAGAVSFSHGDRWGGFTSVYFFYQASMRFGKATK